MKCRNMLKYSIIHSLVHSSWAVVLPTPCAPPCQSTPANPLPHLTQLLCGTCHDRLIPFKALSPPDSTVFTRLPFLPQPSSLLNFCTWKWPRLCPGSSPQHCQLSSRRSQLHSFKYHLEADDSGTISSPECLIHSLEVSTTVTSHCRYSNIC